MFRENRHILISEASYEGREKYRSLFEKEPEPGQFFETDLFPDTLSLLGFFYAQYRLGKRIPLSLLDTGKDFADGCSASHSLLDTDPETMIILVSDLCEFSPDQQKCLRPHVYFFRKPVPSESLYSLACTLLRNWNARLSLYEEAQKPRQNSGNIIFDENGVTERMGRNPNLIRMMMKTFVTNVPKQLHQLKEKLTLRDSEEIKRMGHTLKGSSATAGAVVMQEIAFAIETAGKNGEIEEADRLIRELETAFAQIKQTAAEKGLI